MKKILFVFGILLLVACGSISPSNYTIAEQIYKSEIAIITYPTDIVDDWSRAVVQSPEQLIESKKGHCWEQTELARKLFNESNIPNETYFIDVVINDLEETQTHTFLVFQQDSEFYWFEHSWRKYPGIHKYNSLKELLSDVVRKMLDEEKEKGNNREIVRIREYSAPKLPTGHMDYFYHCLSSKEIKLEDL